MTADDRHELVRIDATGTAHPVGRTASQRLRARQGAFRLLPSPQHLVVMRLVGEDGRRDPTDGPVFRIAGEITSPGALCDIVALIGQAGWRGELHVLDGTYSRTIFFDAGCVVSAHSSAEGERLGEILYRYGTLTEAQVAETVQAVTPDLRFGEAAVNLGFLTREKLFQIIGKQLEEIVHAVLLVGDGTYYFLEGFDEARLFSRQPVTVSSLLMEGVRRMDEMRYFRERIPSDLHVPARLPDKPPPADEELQAVYECVDGALPLVEICRIVEESEFEVTRKLFQLLQSGHVVMHAPRPTGPAAVVELFNEAMAALLEEVDRVGHGGEVREQLSSFATGAGVYDALFQKAGPRADGSLDTERICENVLRIVGPDQAEVTLGQWLYEYVSFAVFVSEPHLRSRPNADGPPISKRIADLVAPLAPGR